ncbi:hypothetical protein J6590_021562 [Homalodisca vitripennis]|nr:hypothetical protein J6590_095207 [Homalodisca vitripennis]KAG8263895.1 hypothetical protein J6590_021562 [Homalodisca vitripennis]
MKRPRRSLRRGVWALLDSFYFQQNDSVINNHVTSSLLSVSGNLRLDRCSDRCQAVRMKKYDASEPLQATVPAMWLMAPSLTTDLVEKRPLANQIRPMFRPVPSSQNEEVTVMLQGATVPAMWLMAPSLTTDLVEKRPLANQIRPMFRPVPSSQNEEVTVMLQGGVMPVSHYRQQFPLCGWWLRP